MIEVSVIGWYYPCNYDSPRALYHYNSATNGPRFDIVFADDVSRTPLNVPAHHVFETKREAHTARIKLLQKWVRRSGDGVLTAKRKYQVSLDKYSKAVDEMLEDTCDT